MRIQFQHKQHIYVADLSKPIDLSIPLEDSSRNPIAWYLDRPNITPAELDDWTGSVQKGASVNFNNISFNPHAHGTHTECLGHITEKVHSVNKALREYFFLAEVISVAPELKDGDQVISRKQLKALLKGKHPQAVIIRTLPNLPAKKSTKHSNTNWPYLEWGAATLLRESGVDHLLIDQPSVDKEKDEGRLAAHKAFWNIPDEPRMYATITEMIYVPNKVSDGTYLLNLQTAPFVNDATPSRPVLFKLG